MNCSEISLTNHNSLYKYDNVITIHTSIGEVPLYKFIEKFLWIEDADGLKVKFILNEDQCDLYISMCEQRLRGEPIRINILKARQKGFSTFIAAVIFCMTIFQAGQKAAIVADIAEHATNLFEKYNFFYENLPTELQLKRIRSNAKELVVKYTNGQTSSVRIMVQGDSAGRSGTYQYLHLSECAFWADLQDTLVSLFQTVSATNKNSMVFIETTANGANEYKSRWDNDFVSKTRYQAKFYPWYTTQRYRVEEGDFLDYDKPLWLAELQQKEKLDDRQTKWYYDRFNDVNGDIDKLRQEYPSNPVEAFVTSGNSVFNMELLLARKAELVSNSPLKKQGFFSFHKEVSIDGSQISISEIKWVNSPIGAIKIFEEPKSGHPYVINNDPAMGGEDYFATQVIDNTNAHQVAVYHKNKCDADDAAFQMYCLLKYYSDGMNAMACGETNTTSYLLKTLYKCGWRFIYQEQDYENLNGRYMDKFGYKTKQTNRNVQIELFAESFRDDPKIINDYETICEMESFQVIRNETTGKEKAQASGGAHDDLVMSYAGYFLCRNSQKFIPIEALSKKRMSIEELEYEIIEKKKRKQERNVYQIWD